MTNKTFISAGVTYKITVNPAPADGKKYPMVLLVHGNAGLTEPYGSQIHGFAQDLANLGYLTAVPQYFADDMPYFEDTTPRESVLADAIDAVTARPDADPDRLGLIGFSLGATTAMALIASSPAGKVEALADFFGFLTPTIETGVANFPPTLILHNKNDTEFVPVANSENLDRLLQKEGVVHHLELYDEIWPEGFNHAFEPGGPADLDSRSKTTDWLKKYLPTTGK